jgi:hypothetical protein
MVNYDKNGHVTSITIKIDENLPHGTPMLLC